MDVRFLDDAPHAIEADLLAIGTGRDFEQELAELDARFDGQLLAWLKEREFDGGEGALRFPAFGRIAAREILVLGLGDRSRDRVLLAAARAGRDARGTGARTLALAFGAGLDAAALIEAVGAGNYSYDAYKPEKDRKPPVETLGLVRAGSLSDEELNRVRARIANQSFTRDLVNAPAADIYPETLAEQARTLARKPHVEVEVWDFERCRKEGCVGIVAVGQGSVNPGCLIHVRYRPPGAKQHVALVGKGVTFDSGGLSLKPSAGMQTMRCDMGGAATVLGAVGAAADMGLPVAVDVFVGAVENMNSGNAFKLGDVLKYANGVTVEIHNTDAEGRLVLADCLIQACRVDGVSTVIDVATLTGACAIAVGPDFTGLFTADDELAATLQRHASANVEGLWRLPLHAPYKRMLKAEWGQIKNVGGREAGATTAALYLQHFVTDSVKWAHLDIAGSAFHDSGDSRYAAGATGEMVRTLASWLEDLG